MKTLLLAVLAAVFFLSTLVTPQISHSGVAIREMARMYNADNVTTVKCVVVESGRVEQVRGPILGSSYGINLKVDTIDGTLTVYLGPSWFIERQDMKFDKNDIIEVKGCKKRYEGKSVIVAQEVRKGSLVLKLRDSNGNPVWENKPAVKVHY